MSGDPVIQAGSRFGRRGRHRRLRLGIAAAVLASLAAGGWALLTSSVFALQTVRYSLDLNATSSLDQAEVAAAARVPLRRPLIEVDVAAIGHRVAEVPGVQSVSVHRLWPHTLLLRVVARRAAARLISPAGRFFADPRGVVYSRTAPAAPRGSRVPSIRMAGALQVASRPQADAAAAVRALESLPVPVRGAARHYRYAAADGLSFDYHRIHVVWGGAAGSERKAAELAALADRRRARRPGWADVSTPGVLVTRRARVAPPSHAQRDVAGQGRDQNA